MPATCRASTSCAASASRRAPNEITLVIGPNGAGKSTLLRTVFAFLTPNQGSITFARARDRGAAPERPEGRRHQLRDAGHQQLSRPHGGGQPAHGRVGVPPRRRAAAPPARARLRDVSGARRQAARPRRRALRRPGPHALGRARADDRAAAAAGRRADRGPRAQPGRAGLRHPARPRRRRAASRSCWSSRTSSRRFRSPIISISSISAG